MLIQIENDGGDIVSTSYWQTEHAARGFIFVSINAGTFRVLVPGNQQSIIPDILTAREVLITRGPWPAQGKSDALEILFEDHSDAPFSLCILPEQVDRMPADTDRDRKGQPHRWKCSVWTSQGKILELPCRYRLAKYLPCLKPWDQ